MNERIRELYNQSLEEKYQYGGSDAKPGEMYSNYITVLNPEKFAELIVRECMSLMESERDYYSKPGMYESREYYERMRAKEDAFEDAASIIKSYFGVEE